MDVFFNQSFPHEECRLLQVAKPPLKLICQVSKKKNHNLLGYSFIAKSGWPVDVSSLCHIRPSGSTSRSLSMSRSIGRKTA